MGILPFLPLPDSVKPYAEPAVLYSFVAGFVVYMVLGEGGTAAQGRGDAEGGVA